MFKIYSFMDKKNDYTNSIMMRIKGFKSYLEIVEKDKLEKLVNDNPNYFYNILPYTYVLDISDKWIKKFQILNVNMPIWYKSYINNIDHFYALLNKIFDNNFYT